MCINAHIDTPLGSPVAGAGATPSAKVKEHQQELPSWGRVWDSSSFVWGHGNAGRVVPAAVCTSR